MLLNEVKLQQRQESVRMPRQAFNNIKGISITGVQHETVTATVWARGAPHSIKIQPKQTLSFWFEGPIDGYLSYQ
jgi:hypothetical protein